MAQTQRSISFLTRLRYRLKVYIERFKRRKGLYLSKWNNTRFGIVPQDHSIKYTRKIFVRCSKRTDHIEVHVYEPRSLTVEEGKPLPVLINLHGSGFILINLGDDAEYCTHWADSLGCVVLDMDYAKGPEHPYPAACEDALDVISYVKANPKLYDPACIALCGFSAGASVALLAGTQAPAGTVKAVIAWYPWTDFSLPRPSPPIPEKIPAVYVPTEMFDIFQSSWVRPGQDLQDPKLSATFTAPGLFPPTTIIVGSHDPFFEEDIALAEKLKLAGCDCQNMVVDDAGHAWDRIASAGTPQRAATLDAMKLMDKRLRAAFGMGSTRSASEQTEETLQPEEAELIELIVQAKRTEEQMQLNEQTEETVQGNSQTPPNQQVQQSDEPSQSEKIDSA